MKPFEEKKPSCEIRKPTLRGACSATGGSIRRSSFSSAIKRKITPETDSCYKPFRFVMIMARKQRLRR